MATTTAYLIDEQTDRVLRRATREDLTAALASGRGVVTYTDGDGMVRYAYVGAYVTRDGAQFTVGLDDDEIRACLGGMQ